MVFQQFNLFPHLTILENCTLAPIWVKRMPKREAHDLAMHYLHRVKIPEQAHKYPGQLSGGQQQRVAIARAVIARPRLLLADEPTGNIDDRLAMRLMHLFVELNKLGTTVMVATHNEAMVERMGFPVLRLDAELVEPGGRGEGPTRGTRLSIPVDEAALIADAFEPPAAARSGRP
jgi:general L-amino acid transport system ATP-binding protein